MMDNVDWLEAAIVADRVALKRRRNFETARDRTAKNSAELKTLQIKVFVSDWLPLISDDLLALFATKISVTVISD
ncbi:hypothetical protein Pla110_42560 [Polystyrenella longa]|uniref:Uncharacterized protein n=1 Tax=Polystyrenella longa TaxID=2528007 RepID=A0A518CTF4_9PLAN|nr:hypothetical protein Pla110_42560 [Polystyrenella longa]